MNITADELASALLILDDTRGKAERAGDKAMASACLVLTGIWRERWRNLNDLAKREAPRLMLKGTERVR